MKFLENTKLVINLAITLTTLSVVYFLIVFTNIQKRVANIKDEDRAKFESCLSEAMQSYLSEWRLQCAENKKDVNCTTLPSYVGVKLTNEWKENKLNCAKLYKQFY
jgi:hypothetical protein